ncbi:MAG TPA: ATPase, T2SS/T4P/T4SS family, partial [Amnibacterium sp.]|nr:ATPase, T2SS/T4P/T4SS family [Amnibacterium sp.]
MASLTEILGLRGESAAVQDSGGPKESWIDDEEAVRRMVDAGQLTSAQVAAARAAQMNLPIVELADFPVDRAAIALVPAAICRRYEVLPVALEGQAILLAMVNPGNVFALDDVSAAARREVRPVIAERSDLLSALNKYHRADGEMSDLTVAIEEETISSSVEIAEEVQDSDAPIVRFVNLLVSQAIQDHASDIHIEPGEHELRVRYRIDGVLHEMQHAPKVIQNGVISRLKIMSDIDIAERRRPQDG